MLDISDQGWVGGDHPNITMPHDAANPAATCNMYHVTWKVVQYISIVINHFTKEPSCGMALLCIYKE